MAGPWRLDLVWAGRTYTFTSEIEASMESSFSLLDGLPGDDAVDLTVYLEGVDVCAEVERGRHLTGASGTLYRDDVVVMVGRVVDPIYDEGPEISFTLRDAGADDTALIPPAGAVVDATTWPLHDETSSGRYYPIVFGAPGGVPSPGVVRRPLPGRSGHERGPQAHDGLGPLDRRRAEPKGGSP